MRQVGATIGVAVLGTVLNSVYRSHLELNGLPAAISDAAKSSVAAGVTVAHTLRSASLLESVRTAFVHGMDIMLWTCAGIAIVSAVLALAFLPRRSGQVSEGETGSIAAGSGEPGPERAGLGI
jgi:DHA2 family multidrug resistance protein-like MFS transporter